MQPGKATDPGISHRSRQSVSSEVVFQVSPDEPLVELEGARRLGEEVDCDRVCWLELVMAPR